MADNMLVILGILFVTIATCGARCPSQCRSCTNNIADCSKVSLVTTPNFFDPTTKNINLDGNKLRSLGRRSFSRLPNVEVLRVSRNTIKVIKKDAFVTMPKLMTMDMSNNRISRIYTRSFMGLKNLQTLSLASNNIGTVTGILDTMPSLFQLNLGRNRIKIIHAKTFYRNTRLHYLDLRENNIIRIHEDAFKHQRYLRYLFLNNNPVATVPDLNIGSPVLQLIDFSHCNLKEVPHGFPASVRDLRLGHNQITEINEKDFEKITDLRLLALNNNRINRVGFQAFKKLRDLQEIWLRDNQLIYIPRGLPDNLRKLYMDMNRVVNIEAALFSTSSRLEYLTLEKNQVQDIEPQALAHLRNLKYLNLQGNRLITLTKGMFADVRNVSTLTLSNNPISRVEKGAFENMVNLTSLFISYVPPSNFILEDNFLHAMPGLEKFGLMGSQSFAVALLKIIGDGPVMRRMRELDLTFNDIETLPSSLQKILPNIQALSIDGNSLVCDDRLRWLARWMKTSNVKFFAYEEPKCEQPYRHKGKLLKDVPEQQFEAIRRDLPPLPQLPPRHSVNDEPARPSPARRAPVRQAPAWQAPAKAPVKQAPARQAPARQAPARQAPARQAPVRRVSRPRDPSQVRQRARPQVPATRPPQTRVARPNNDRAARKRLRSKQRRGKTDRRRRRKRRHRRTDEERRQLRKERRARKRSRSTRTAAAP